MCADSALSAQQFLSCSCQPSLFSAENKWKEIWCELEPTHFQAKMACKEKVSLPEAKKLFTGLICRRPHKFHAYGKTQWLQHRLGREVFTCEIHWQSLWVKFASMEFQLKMPRSCGMFFHITCTIRKHSVDSIPNHVLWNTFVSYLIICYEMHLCLDGLM